MSEVTSPMLCIEVCLLAQTWSEIGRDLPNVNSSCQFLWQLYLEFFLL